jgi:hypothetical protein
VFSSLGVVGDTSFSGVIVGMIAFMIVGGLLYSAVWVWSIIDFIIAVTGNFKDSQGKVIKRW